MNELIYSLLAQLLIFYSVCQVINYFTDSISLHEWRIRQSIWETEASIRWYEEQIQALENFKNEINRQLLAQEWREDWWHDDTTKPPTLH